MLTFEEKIAEHSRAQKTINALNEEFNIELQNGTGLEGITNAIKRFCFSCMQPINPDCEICNGHPRRMDEVSLSNQ